MNYHHCCCGEHNKYLYPYTTPSLRVASLSVAKDIGISDATMEGPLSQASSLFDRNFLLHITTYLLKNKRIIDLS